MRNAVFGTVILWLIVAAGIILYTDISERFRLHPRDSRRPDPARARSQWQFPERSPVGGMLAVVAVRLKRGNGIVRRTLQLSIPRYGGERLTLCRT
jgi:hypothetical protein